MIACVEYHNNNMSLWLHSWNYQHFNLEFILLLFLFERKPEIIRIFYFALRRILRKTFNSLNFWIWYFKHVFFSLSWYYNILIISLDHSKKINNNTSKYCTSTSQSFRETSILSRKIVPASFPYVIAFIFYWTQCKVRFSHPLRLF